MSKKIIGIDINEVLRPRSMQFDRYYVDEFGEEGLPEEGNEYTFDLRNNYKWEDGDETTQFLNEDLPEDISPIDYEIDEKTGVAPVDAFAFKSETNFVTADEKYKRFLYQDYLLEIHGLAPLLYPELSKDIEKFYVQYKDQFEIKIISKENWFTIPPTLFFLSKVMPRIKNYQFVDNNDEMWDNVDILITTDPELLDNAPEGKVAVKLSRPYNGENEGDVETLQVVELVDNEDFQNMVGYEKPVEEVENEK